MGVFKVNRNVQTLTLAALGKGKYERGFKFLELSNHLGNVLVTITDKKIQVNASGVVSSYLADIVTAQDYYPFGMAMPGRKYTVPNGDNYRYGFNGKENDKDISEGGQDYGARVYDNRLGRWLSVDPQFSRGPQFAPYVQSFNNPINIVDEKGEWGVLAHYRMIKRALIKSGISKKTAEEIAYYGSTYADGAHGFVLFLNQLLGMLGGTPSQKLAIKDKNDKTLSESQSDQSIQMVSIHAMKTAFECNDVDAVDRALNGGSFKDKNGKTVVIEGALNVIERFKGRDIEKLSIEEKKELGVAFHTLGDAIAHMGKRWVNSKIGKKDAKALGYKNEHEFLNDLLNFKGIEESQGKIVKAIETISKKDETSNKKNEEPAKKSE